MTYIDCCRLTRRLAPVLGPALLVAALGCREDARSPTAPETEPALDIMPVHALSFRQVSAGISQHSCGATTGELAYCWGKNTQAQLGDGTLSNRSTPVAVAGGLRFRQVSAGGAHSCGVTPDNLAYCWGDAVTGALGDGIGGDRLRGTPVAVAGGLRFRKVSSGLASTCGITTENLAYCWGNNFAGELGDGTTTRRIAPVPVAGGLRFRQVSAPSYTHTCGVTTDNLAYCWGANDFGQLGNGTTSHSLTPVRVAGGLRFSSVRAESAHTCGVTTGDRAYCWGFNGSGQLGDGTLSNRRRPVPVAGGLAFDQVTAGSQHSCGVTPGSRAYCWGLNNEGQLGDRTFSARLTPVGVVGGLLFRQVDAGGDHTCGVTTDNQGYCWGSNAFGKLGDGTFSRRTRPVPIAGAT